MGFGRIIFVISEPLLQRRETLLEMLDLQTKRLAPGPIFLGRAFETRQRRGNRLNLGLDVLETAKNTVEVAQRLVAERVETIPNALDPIAESPPPLENLGEEPLQKIIRFGRHARPFYLGGGSSASHSRLRDFPKSRPDRLALQAVESEESAAITRD
jgi:hypothetical protein